MVRWVICSDRTEGCHGGSGDARLELATAAMKQRVQVMATLVHGARVFLDVMVLLARDLE